ncbi:T9SS type A sorting domain-containing protein [Lewinella sp. IMCC34191]|uniref:T9SS type A sorting domain-containing protein n=1 Tax=Lewinella sp. IMCC34191 TaxID=2259172 RepID=UPI0013003413|nr:T9SS type A sorting domain-containing protein [Lewinella sp. IMCC34191]
MRLLLLLIPLFLPLCPLIGQNTILYFNWEATDPKISEIGPDAASIGNLAATKLRLDGNTRGLAVSQTSTKQNLDLVLADAPLYNVGGIDISFDYQRDETVYTVLRRNNFYLGNGGLNVQYRVSDGAGGSQTITSPTFEIENDDVYRTYRFRYEPVSGIGTLYKDGVTVWTSAATPGRNLYWVGDGDLTIGVDMDGSGTQNAVLDNFTIVELASALPVLWETFTAQPRGETAVALAWTTGAEVNNDYFLVQRSTDGSSWRAIDSMAGSGSTPERQEYRSQDDAPRPGINYYRLEQFDYDGTSSYSPVRSVMMPHPDGVAIYPNPTTDFVTVTTAFPYVAAEIVVRSDGGQRVGDRLTVRRETPTRFRLDFRSLPTGCYVVVVGGRPYRVCKLG